MLVDGIHIVEILDFLECHGTVAVKCLLVCLSGIQVVANDIDEILFENLEAAWLEQVDRRGTLLYKLLVDLLDLKQLFAIDLVCKVYIACRACLGWSDESDEFEYSVHHI